MSDDEENEIADLSSPEVVDKYKTAADIANRVMKAAIEHSTVGTPLVTVCKQADELIEELTKAVYGKSKKKKKMEKGIAFPTSVSLNNVVGHFSPLGDEAGADSEHAQAKISEGDLVKIDLAVHIDGYIATLAHSFIASEQPTQPTSGPKADVICAAHFAGEAALRLLKPGNKNTQVTEVIKAVAEQFNVRPVEGVLSHQLKRFVIDGNRVIMNRETADQHAEEFTFEEGEVYSLDIVMSSGDGKTREGDAKTTIFKRAVEQNYQLKLNSARAALKEIETRFGAMAFNARALSEPKLRLGLVECVRHGLLVAYPVLYERPEAVVAQFKFTALILPSGIQKLASVPLPYVTSEFSVTDAKLLALLEQGLKRTTAKKKKSKKKKEAVAGESGDAESAPMQE